MEVDRTNPDIRTANVPSKSALRNYLPYPVMVVLQVGFWWYSIEHNFDFMAATGISLGASFIAAIALERLNPLRTDWAMTKKTFFGRDYKYYLLSLPLLNFVIPLLATSLSLGLVDREQSRFGGIPLVVEIVLAIAGFDFIQYWYHRATHRMPYRSGLLGAIGRRLWTVHSSHHEPEQVYVMMHPISHPIEIFAIRLGFQVAFFSLAGFSTEAIFVTGCIIGFQGIIGHCNADIRMGPISYILTGPETHRYHHSNQPEDDGNFAIAFILWDVLFGTFVYRPGDGGPVGLGVYDQSVTVSSKRFWATMVAPFT